MPGARWFSPGNRPDDRHPLRRLSIIGVVLPILIVVAAEMASLDVGGRPALVALVISSAVAIWAFGAGMFHLINRQMDHILAERASLRAAHELTLALRGLDTVAEVVDTACQRVAELTGSPQVSIELAGSRRPAPPAGPEDDAQLALPLVAEGATVGTLRLAPGPEPLPRAMVEALAPQVAGALATAAALERRRRRDAESQRLHAILTRVSRQEALGAILTTIADDALALTAVDRALVKVREEVAREILTDSHSQLTTAFPSAGARASHPAGTARAPRIPLPSRGSPDASACFEVAGPTGCLAELTVWHREPLSDPDRATLRALADVTAVAVTSAQARLQDHHGAILDERQRIARELHDSLAQVLAVTHLRLRTVARRRDVAGTPDLLREVTEIADTCADAYSDVREAILGLHESSHRNRDLVANLEAFLTKYTAQCGISARLEADLDTDLSLGPNTELQLVRVIQEALANVRKHSGADNVTVRILQGPVATVVTISDDGHGFDTGSAQVRRDGYGLFTMRERLALLGGRLSIESSPGWGTTILAEVPGGSRPRDLVVQAGGDQHEGSVREGQHR